MLLLFLLFPVCLALMEKYLHQFNVMKELEESDTKKSVQSDINHQLTGSQRDD